MEGFKKMSWNEFRNHPGVLEAMTKVYEATGCTILYHQDTEGNVTDVYPIEKET